MGTVLMTQVRKDRGGLLPVVSICCSDVLGFHAITNMRAHHLVKYQDIDGRLAIFRLALTRQLVWRLNTLAAYWE